MAKSQGMRWRGWGTGSGDAAEGFQRTCMRCRKPFRTRNPKFKTCPTCFREKREKRKAKRDRKKLNKSKPKKPAYLDIQTLTSNKDKKGSLIYNPRTGKLEPDPKYLDN